MRSNTMEKNFMRATVAAKPCQCQPRRTAATRLEKVRRLRESGGHACSLAAAGHVAEPLAVGAGVLRATGAAALDPEVDSGAWRYFHDTLAARRSDGRGRAGTCP